MIANVLIVAILAMFFFLGLARLWELIYPHDRNKTK